MDMKKAKLDGRFMTVVGLDEYRATPDSFPQLRTAIELPDLGVVLPLMNKFDTSVGIYVGSGLFSKVNMPNAEKFEEYRQIGRAHV